MWLDGYEHDIEFNLAASTGPCGKQNEILSLASEEEREKHFGLEVLFAFYAAPVTSPAGLKVAAFSPRN